MSREKYCPFCWNRGILMCQERPWSRTLGISRAAVWKAIEALRQEGYEIQSATKRGYRLERAPDRVREGELAGPLSGCHVGSRLICLDVIDSTNTGGQAPGHGRGLRWAGHPQ